MPEHSDLRFWERELNMVKVKQMLELLSKDQVYQIHMASMQILEKVGVRIPDSDLLKTLEETGAVVDYKSRIAKLPQQLVMEFVRKIPNQWTIYARNRENDMKVGYGEMRTLSSGGNINLIDPMTKTRRTGTTEDLEKGIKIGDALEDITIVGPLILPAHDIPIEALDVYTYAQLIKGSSKTVFTWIYNEKTAKHVLKIFEILAGGEEALRKRPMLWYFCEPTSPLTFATNALSVLKLTARYGLPVTFGPMVMASASGPATLAGTLAVENAEIVAGAVITQILNPGVPVEYGGIPHIFDQRSGMIAFGSPEQGVMAAAITQVGRFYGFPVHVNTGLTDSKVPDAQSAFEKGMTILMGGLAGAELYGHLGILGADQGVSFEQLVIDDEIVSYLKRMLADFRTEQEDLAVDVAERVGPGGSFLTQRHTLQHLRSEFWYPSLCDRLSWDKWFEKGAKDMLVRAHEKVDKILKSHEPEPLEKDMEKAIDQQVRYAFKELAK